MEWVGKRGTIRQRSLAQASDRTTACSDQAWAACYPNPSLSTTSQAPIPWSCLTLLVPRVSWESMGLGRRLYTSQYFFQSDMASPWPNLTKRTRGAWGPAFKCLCDLQSLSMLQSILLWTLHRNPCSGPTTKFPPCSRCPEGSKVLLLLSSSLCNLLTEWTHSL